MNTDELIEHVTNDLIAAIENGADTWQMPWHTIATNAQPRSIDDRPYRGLNAVVLALTAAANGWPSGTWATYRGWQRHGAQVRRGERATHVLLWKPARPATERDDSTNEPDDTDTSPAARGRLVSRVFAVFAAEQVDGADSTLTDRDEPRDTPERIAAADTYFASIGADVITGGNRACYIPADDRIHVPHLSQFEQPALYYSTTCHEHVHWTAHPSRLARDLTGRFGDDAYAVEELIAELGAAFWCAQSAIAPATRHDHASYLAHWVRVLKEHPRVLLTVAARAQAALDYLNQLAGVTTAPATADAA
ncbi:MAG: DUF1738 domain-containing protein [Actinobacteria bacterium]|nr:DUF1738 domain-containing protein [Actinomycetota bacterium]